MRKLLTKIFLCLQILPVILFAQANGKDFGFAASINYTTTSKLFLQPNLIDPILRNIHENVDAIYSYSFELRYQVSESILAGIGTEYFKATYKNDNMNLSGVRVSMTDGYKMIPIELTIYYQLPLSTEQFKFFMAGGLGLYYGEQIRELGDVTVSTDSRTTGYGFHVAVGMDYVMFNFVSLRAQMRFRDPEFEMKNKYSNKTVNYSGRKLTLPVETFDSKVNIDGITFTLGVVFNFGF